MGKVLALDYGEKRVGVAVSADEGRVAFPRDHVDPGDLEKLIQLVHDEEVVEIIVGYPVTLEGKESASAQGAKKFVEELKTKVSVPIWLIDERLSTKEVLRELNEMGQDLKKHKDKIDSFVAQKMLERYLEKTR